MSNLFNWVTSAATPTGNAATPSEPEDEAATPPPAPQETDAIRRSTRACVINRNNLQLPPQEPRRLSPQERLRIRAGRSPSPSPTASAAAQHFEFQAPTMDADAIRALVQETLRASSIAAVQAATMTVQETLPEAVRSAMNEQVRDVTALTRKPELPTFDSANIETWIRRVENAYTRACITKAKDKFAFIESKVGVNSDPKVTEFLCVNPQTDATWTDFLAYLRKRYGRTKRQQIQSLISGSEFDGLQPSAVCSLMKEKAGQVTVDDIIKEHIYRRLPVELQRQLAQDAETMSAAELSELADAFYDKDGRPLHTASNSSVNAVAAASNSPSSADNFTAAFDDDYGDVNAVRARQAQKQRYNNNNARSQGNSSNNSRYSNSANRPSNSSSNARGNNKTIINSSGICGYHAKFQNDAQKCAPGCNRWSAFQQKNGQASSSK